MDLQLVDDLVDFVRGRGYVLNFSDRSYSEFFAAELNIDIDDPIYAERGGSKGRRLRCFLTKTDDVTAARALKALWDCRVDYLIRSGEVDPVPQAETRFRTLLSRLSRNSLQSRKSRHRITEERGPGVRNSKAGPNMTASELAIELTILRTLKSLGSSEFHSDQDVLSALDDTAPVSDLDLLSLAERTEYLADRGLVTWKPLNGDGTILAFMAKITGHGQQYLRDQTHPPSSKLSPTPRAVPPPLSPYDETQQLWHTDIPEMEVYGHPLPVVPVAILVAVEVELLAVLRKMLPLVGRSSIARYHDSHDVYYLGKFGAYDCIVAMCTNTGTLGPGGATLTASRLLDKAAPQVVIMPGICFGRLGKKQNIGDVLVATEVICYEPERVGETNVSRTIRAQTSHGLLTLFRNTLTWKFRRPDSTNCVRYFGGMLSGEKLVDNFDLVNKLFETYPTAVGGEMEGAGLYGAAAEKKIDFIVVKGVCDWGVGKADDHQALAAAASVSLVEDVLKIPGLFREGPKSAPSAGALQAEGIHVEWWQCLNLSSDPSRRRVEPYHQTYLKVTFRVENPSEQPTTLKSLEYIQGEARLQLVGKPPMLRTREADHGGGGQPDPRCLTPQNLHRLDAYDAREVEAWLSGALLPLPSEDLLSLTLVLRDVRGSEAKFDVRLEPRHIRK